MVDIIFGEINTFFREVVAVVGEVYELDVFKAKAFAEASRRGWEWAHNNPEETLDIVMKVIEKENMPADRQHQEWMLKEVLKLQIDKKHGTATFELDEEKINQINDILLKNNRINEPITKSQITGKQ